LPKDLHTGRYRIEPGHEVHLSDVDPNNTSGFEGKDEDEQKESKKLNEKLRQLQEMLYAEHEQKVLVVLQAMDTGGKDGVINRVFQGVNPQGVRVAHFKEPTPEELDHGFVARAQTSAWKGRAYDFQPEPLRGRPYRESSQDRS
jgi:polyphosphate kinase 2 (PPK2 family)